MRSEGPRLHAEDPSRMHSIARKESAERERFEQARILRGEEIRTQPRECGDRPMRAFAIECLLRGPRVAFTNATHHALERRIPKRHVRTDTRRDDAIDR